MNRVSLPRLGQRELHLLALELVAAVLDPIRPRHEHLSAARGWPRAWVKTVKQRLAGHLVRAQPAAEIDEADSLLAAGDLDVDV
jgi:hypothetical protein